MLRAQRLISLVPCIAKNRRRTLRRRGGSRWRPSRTAERRAARRRSTPRNAGRFGCVADTYVLERRSHERARQSAPSIRRAVDVGAQLLDEHRHQIEATRVRRQIHGRGRTAGRSPPMKKRKRPNARRGALTTGRGSCARARRRAPAASRRSCDRPTRRSPTARATFRRVGRGGGDARRSLTPARRKDWRRGPAAT